MATMEQNTCAHPQCSCPVNEGQQFCSTQCSDTAKTGATQTSCGCDHPQCKSAQAA